MHTELRKTNGCKTKKILLTSQMKFTPFISSQQSFMQYNITDSYKIDLDVWNPVPLVHQTLYLPHLSKFLLKLVAPFVITNIIISTNICTIQPLKNKFKNSMNQIFINYEKDLNPVNYYMKIYLLIMQPVTTLSSEFICSWFKKIK